MSAQHRELLETYVDAYNRADWDALRACVTVGYVHHNNGDALTVDGFVGGATWFRNALPDFRIDVQDVVCEGDRAAVRFQATGTHRGSMFGEEPTATVLVLHGQTLFRFEDGLIAEDWETMDEQDLRRQAGAA